MRLKFVFAFAFTLAAAMFVASAAAQEIASVYTPLVIENNPACRVVGQDREHGGISWRCDVGYRDISVFVSDFDGRNTVSFGPEGDRERAANQTLGPFNTAGETIEWRLEGGDPFATILRWRTSVDDGTGGYYEGEVLVVTRLAPACQIAWVDARANPDANTLARQAADESARDFDCETDEIAVYGMRGRSW